MSARGSVVHMSDSRPTSCSRGERAHRHHHAQPPEARNALSSEVLRLLPQLMREADADDDVDVVILTGADPAFCAGLDLKELGSTGGNLGGSGADGTPQRATASAARSPR